MKSLRRWGIRERLILAFVGVLIPYLGLVAIGAAGFQALWHRIQSIQDEVVIEVRGAADLEVALLGLLLPSRDYLVLGDPAERGEFELRLADAEKILARLDPIVNDPEERRLLKAVRHQIGQIEVLSREILASPNPRGDRAAVARMETLDLLARETAAAMRRFREVSEVEIAEDIRRGRSAVRSVIAWAVAAAVLSVAGGLGLALIFARWIERPLDAIVQGSRRMAGGDLSARVEEAGGAELDETARAFNQMAERLDASFAALGARKREIETLHRSAQFFAGERDPDRVLQRLVEAAAELVGARYGALGVFGEDGQLGQFLTAGLTPEERERIARLPEGRGLLGHIFKRGETLRLDDLAAHPASVGFPPGHPPMRGLLGMPIRLGGEILGVLYMTEKPGGFTADDERLLETLCQDAAVTIENARLQQETEAQRQSAEALAAVGQDLGRSLDLAVVGQRITDRIRELLHLPFSGLFRLEPESGDLVGLAVSENLASGMGRNPVFPRGTGAVGLAVSEGRPVVSEDVLADPRITFTPEARIRVEQAQFRGVLAAPLLAEDRVIGVLAVGGRAGRVFSDKEIRLAEAFAAQAALALKNARLFDEARRALVDLQVAQEQLIRDSTLRALGELAAGAAHHLNNLLAIVLGRVRLLLSSPESAPARRPLAIIERATLDAAEVVRRVSRFARQQPLEERAPVDLKRLAAEVREMARSRWQDAAQARGLEIQVVVEGEDVPAIAGNPSALREVLLNLVLNAVDALPDGGRIVLRTFREGSWVGVAVTDNGVGMSREVRERVLDPFFTTKGPKSMGLGLSVAYGTIERHGGGLTIESDEGRGTTITIRLPVASPSRDERGPDEGAQVPALHILLIEDDEEVREILGEMLTSQGHTVLEAGGGRQGLALLEAGEAVDLVLTDLGMPGMAGWEVARAIKARWPRLPVGMLTGWGDAIDEASAEGQAIAGVLSKPITPECLRQFVASCYVRHS